LGYERETAREVLRELRTRYPGIPLVVEAPSDADADLRELLDGCEQLPAPATPEQIVAAVQSLLGQANEEAASGA
jgi:DNA-binding NarL/FixJ family response regulator